MAQKSKCVRLANMQARQKEEDENKKSQQLES